jgi:hypothetical protein
LIEYLPCKLEDLSSNPSTAGDGGAKKALATLPRDPQTGAFLTILFSNIEKTTSGNVAASKKQRH